MNEQSWKNVLEVMKSVKLASASGPNRIPYNVYESNYGDYWN